MDQGQGLVPVTAAVQDAGSDQDAGLVPAFIALGANLGQACDTVRWAMAALGQLPQTRLLRCSSLYRSAPLQASGDDFINAVAAIATGLSALELLAALQQLEQLKGRRRSFVNAPRTLDLDILLYGAHRIEQAELQIPHPCMYQRAFVLLPLAEIAPQYVSAQQLAALSWQVIKRLA